MTKFKISVLFISIVLVISAGMRLKAQLTPADVKDETVQRWTVVESYWSSQYEGSKNRYSTLERRWVIAPNGTWRIIPEGHKAWAATIVEGQEIPVTDLPQSINHWDEPYQSASAETAELQRGDLTQIKNEGTTRSHRRGIYFFSISNKE